MLGHGWYSLAPYRTAADGMRLETVVALPEGGACPIRLEPSGDAVELRTPGRPKASTRRYLEAAARRVLSLDVDLEPFYVLVEGDPSLPWVAATGSGRLMRCPTMFEDLVKLVLTTNCSWALTLRMVGSLVKLYGERAPDGSRSFPRPDRLAAAGKRALRERVKTGYRAPLLAELARRVAEGEVDPEAWATDRGDPAELRAELLKLPGVGPYVAENVLRLLGRPCGLGLDSWLRAKYARIYHGGRRISDRTIARRYSRLGRWAGLGLWCDMTEDWFEDQQARADSLQ